MLAAATVAAAPATDFDAAAAFGAMPLFRSIQVSPNGEMLAAVVRSGGRSGLAVIDITEGVGFKRFVEDSDALKVGKFFWKADDRLVFSARIPGNRYGTPVVETRMFSMEPEGKGIRSLYRESTRNTGLPPQIQDDVVSWLPNDPQNIYVQYLGQGTNTTNVMRMRVDNPTRHRVVEANRKGAFDWMADRDGNVRVVNSLRNEKTRMLHVKTPDGKWKDISHRIAPGQPNFRIVGLDPDQDTVYITSDHATDTMALYPYSVTNDVIGELLFSHPTSDVYGISLSPKNGRLIGARYAEESPVTHWFGNSLPKKLIKAIGDATDADYVSFHNLNMTGDAAILSVSNGIRPSQYVMFTISSGEMFYLPQQYPDLAGVDMGEVISVEYKARDGLTIPAFVTLPPGIKSLEDAKNLPFAINPHGGPTSRDFAGFDWLAQYLASQGYGVLQMNFRGSDGYGAEFKSAGNREWGQAMQDDISDGAQWLIDQGSAHPDKTMIIGGSYGGYAALMGAVKTPDLFSCAVSLNGVSDLPALISHEAEFVNGSYATRHIGRLWKDRVMLRENSPARRAEDVQIPVLIVHGEKDRVVPLNQGQRMARALERADKDVRFVELDEGSHYLDVNDNRVTFLRDTLSEIGLRIKPF